MKKALITGMNGTVGTALHQYLEAQGIEVVGWNRKSVTIDDYQTMEDFVRQTAPDVLFHLATASQPTGRENEAWLVNYDWTSELAWICRQLNVTFVFTSTVMVFTNDAMGPFTIHTQPDATQGYGYEKYRAEQQTFYQNPKAVVARLGWQIGQADGSNNMVNHLSNQMAEHGEIRASTKWYPACSFLRDTAATLYRLAQGKHGLYQLDSNEKWSYYEIVTALNEKLDAGWRVVPTEDFVYDQHMIDERVNIASLKDRLPNLP